MFFQIALSLATLSPVECSRRAEFVGSSSEVEVALASPTGETRWVTGLPTGGFEGTGGVIERIQAHAFVVHDVDGGAGNLSVGDTVQIVPWGYRSDCARDEFDAADWIEPDEVGVFFLTEPRLDEGLRLFDVFGEHAPYPQGRFLASLRSPRPPEDRALWLSAGDFFEMMKALPSRENGESPARWLARLESAFSTFPPDWAQRFPGDGILWEARYAVDRGRGPAF